MDDVENPRRWPRWVAAMAVVVSACVVWSWASTDAVPEKAGVATAPSAGAAALPALAAPIEVARREALPVEPAAPEAAGQPATTTTVGAVPGVRFHGTLELRDAADVRLPPPDGELGLIALTPFEEDDAVAPRHVIAVRAGAFDAVVPTATPAAGLFLVERVIVAGRVAWLEETQFSANAAPHAMVARFARPTTLRVTDAATGALLDDVFVVAPKEVYERPGPDRCAPEELIVRGVASPVELELPDPRRDREFRWFLSIVVGSPDHAAAIVDLDLTKGGERLVPLRRGATITVAVEPWRLPPRDPAEGPLVLRPPQPYVRLRHITEFDTAESDAERNVTITHWGIAVEARPDREGRVRFEGVTPGPCTVSVELGDWRAREPALAFEQFELAAGEERAVTLRLPELPALPVAAALAGIVEVPPEWDDLPWALEIRGLRDDDPRRLRLGRTELEPVSGSVGRHRFRIDAVTPGAWIARFTAIEQQQVFEQPVGGRSDLLLVVGPPVSERIELRDADTREPVDVGVVGLWPLRLDPRIHQWWLVEATYDGATRGYLARVPPGAYELSFDDWRYAEPVVPIEVAPDRPVAPLDLERNGGLRIRLRVAGTVLPSGEIVQRVHLAWPDGRGAGTRCYYEPEHVRLVPTRHGACTLTFTPPPGCRAPPERALTLRAGEFVEVDLEFERE